jgi:uncharacterized membrane protein HdeD (DUF308 family)
MAGTAHTNTPDQAWLKHYYFVRFVVCAVWVILAFGLARSLPSLAVVMLVAYPAWDALANFLDARRSGGFARNKSQMLNVVVSVVTAIGGYGARDRGVHAVLEVFGVWAALAGLFQLVTGVRRWQAYGAQWAMILSGAQSCLAGVFMIKEAAGVAPASIADIAPYAGFGAFYFLVSAIWLTVSEARRARKHVAA